MVAAEDNTLSPPDVSRSAKSQTSIISGQSGRDRVDRHGNPIQRGSKNHKCSFRDEHDGNQGIQDMKEVLAYKSPYLGGDYRDDDKQGCACVLM